MNESLSSEIEKVKRELFELDKRNKYLHEKLAALIKLKDVQDQKSREPSIANSTEKNYSLDEKVKLFCTLFRGRNDIFAKRYESLKTGKSGYQPACKNEWLEGFCRKPKVRCNNCENRKLIPLSDDIIRKHIVGYEFSGRPYVVGMYPLLEDDTCWFLAADFDKQTWQEDINSYRETCLSLNVPVYIERSRSGNGAHAWIFFKSPVPAAVARRMGGYILTETMDQNPDLGFNSYDRFFPNQDTMPKGGFGNLIALPLQGHCVSQENSVFVDENFQMYNNQWDFLKLIEKLDFNAVNSLAEMAVRTGKVTGVKMVDFEDDEKPWELSPSKKRKSDLSIHNLPEKINIILNNQIYVEKENLPAKLKNRINRLAAFQNPEFYKKQAMRMPIYNTPRIISCSEEFSKHIGLPRGCAENLTQLLLSLKIKPIVEDKRIKGQKLTINFLGNLRDEQALAVNNLIKYDIGVLSASTAFGKTVLACKMIALRKVNTLILVHRTQLLEQWKEKLCIFLNIDNENVGTYSGSQKKLTGIIDVAMIQSLNKKGKINDLVANYGHIIVDECHHLSAFSFEQVSKQCKAKYFLGLSATVCRKDGHHPIIFMQCGPLRYKVCDRKQAAERPFEHLAIIRKTDLQLPAEFETKEDLSIHDVYNMQMYDETRNELIIQDVINVLKLKRSPIILTERKDQLDYFTDKFSNIGIKNVIVLKGGLTSKKRLAVLEKLKSIPEKEERLLIATGRYIGEGFDDSRLDTLFLALPISWKGTLSQYAGRLHRLNDRKKEVWIYDYADIKIPMANRMLKRRIKGYDAIGYKIIENDLWQPELIVLPGINEKKH